MREVALLWGLSDVAASDAGGEGNEGVVGAVLGTVDAGAWASAAYPSVHGVLAARHLRAWMVFSLVPLLVPVRMEGTGGAVRRLMRRGPLAAAGVAVRGRGRARAFGHAQATAARARRDAIRPQVTSRQRAAAAAMSGVSGARPRPSCARRSIRPP